MPDHPRLAIMADATCKCCHFATAGRAQPMDKIPPWSCSRLGTVARNVLEMYKSGKLKSEAQQRYACAAALEGTDEASCSSNLTCSRASASARGAVDFSGVAAVACAHGTLLANCMVAMPTPEQWPFHFATVKEAVLRRSDINDLYIDVGCRIKNALLAELLEAKLADGRALLHPDVAAKASSDVVLCTAGWWGTCLAGVG